MQNDAFSAYMVASDVAGSTQKSRLYALRRIEDAHGVDLDAEYAADRLARISARLTYTAADAAANAPNPSEIPIDPEKLNGRLSWFRSHLNAYIRFLGGDTPATGEATASDDVVEAVGLTFGLEKDLQDALRKNIAQLEAGLEIIDGGSERRVDAGFIDILARDASGTVVVIELKAVESKPDAVAQILGYMGAVAEQDRLERVRGYLIAADHPKRVRWAAKAVPNLELRTYSFSFQFNQT